MQNQTSTGLNDQLQKAYGFGVPGHARNNGMMSVTQRAFNHRQPKHDMGDLSMMNSTFMIGGSN